MRGHLIADMSPDEKMLVTQVPEPRTPDAPYKSTAG